MLKRNANFTHFKSILKKMSPKKQILTLVSFVIGMLLILYFLICTSSSLTLDFKDSSYPASTLSKVNVSEYARWEFDKLDKFLVFPETNIGISFGGKELKTTDNATGFLYDKGIYLLGASVNRNADFSNVLKHDLMDTILSKKSNSKYEYVEHINDTGFKNSIALSYSAGLLKNENESNYVVAYKYIPKEGNAVIIAAMSEELEQLRKAKEVLDDVVLTISRVEEKKEGTMITDPSFSSSVDSKSFRDAAASTITGHRDYIMDEIEVTKEMSKQTCVFSFEYPYVDKIPKDAYVISPEGSKYNATYLNNYHDGLILIQVNKPTQGRWKLRISNNGTYGQYIFNVWTLDDYNDAHMSKAEFYNKYGDPSDSDPAYYKEQDVTNKSVSSASDSNEASSSKERD